MSQRKYAPIKLDSRQKAYIDAKLSEFIEESPPGNKTKVNSQNSSTQKKLKEEFKKSKAYQNYVFNREKRSKKHKFGHNTVSNSLDVKKYSVLTDQKNHLISSRRKTRNQKLLNAYNCSIETLLQNNSLSFIETMFFSPKNTSVKKKSKEYLVYV